VEDDAHLATFEGWAMRASLGDLLTLQPTVPAGAIPVSAADLPALGEFCRANLLALLQGATPNYFAFGLPDGNIHGAVLTVLDAEGREQLQVHRLSLKNSLPLQSTLFGLTESLAQSVRQTRLSPDKLRELRIVVSVLAEPSMHGSVAEPDLRGVDSVRHALVVMERKRQATVYLTQAAPEELLAAAAKAVGVAVRESTQILALDVLSALPHFRIVHQPRPASGAKVRPAGVAGRFYPADPQELSRLVDRCLPAGQADPQPWPAVMVPHAGLVYSGRVAGQTLQRIRFPQTAIVIGPKHTPHGVDWALAPHETWSIPGATIASDLTLARQLLQAIPGLEADAAAHAQEHAIEVELPLLARLAPRMKVVGIAIGAGDLARCREFAAGLANVIRRLPERPLLIISSDMNHFASDAESRRLDEIALAAMQSLDIEAFYNTVKAQHISMCGLLPAVIVMETLRVLGQLKRIERVAYATSADVSGDASRVVGYAGALLGA
jgi:AmmeMemoRadiSam system protein B